MTDRLCAFCGAAFEARTAGRPRVYCGAVCRQAAARYAERLPAWQAELAQLEADAAGYRGGPPTFIRNRIAELQTVMARYGPTKPEGAPR